MGDPSRDKASSPVRITGKDEVHFADVIPTADGRKRLLVETQEFIDWHYQTIDFKNGTSRNMNVNGSSTAQHFTVAPPAGQIWWLEKVSILLIDGGGQDPDDFGSIGGLLDNEATNGWRLQAQSQGALRTIGSYINNAQLFHAFGHNKSMRESGSGFLNEDDQFGGEMIFTRAIRLVGDQGDYARFTVRDNLNGLEWLTAQAFIRRLI